MSNIETERDCTVAHAMRGICLAVAPSDKITKVAELLVDHRIDALPVVDEMGRCVGIITSTDIIRFQSQLDQLNSEFKTGMSVDTGNDEADGSIQIVPHPFDEVARQMTSTLQTVNPTSSLAMASKIMTQMNIHNLIVLDKSQRPIGILSSLDILTRLYGES